MTVTDTIGAEAAAAHAAHSDADGVEASPRLQHNYRARVWRAALGALGLFWVVAFLLLLR